MPLGHPATAVRPAALIEPVRVNSLVASLIRSFRRYHLLPPRGMNQESVDLAIRVGLKRDSKRQLRGEEVPEAFRPEA